MLSQSKKYFFLVILLGLLGTAYWFFYSSHWGVAITNEQYWEHCFIDKNNPDFDNENYFLSKEKSSISEKSKDQNLVFRKEFIIDNPSQIIEGVIEYNFKYSAKIFINDIEYADVARTLITSTLDKDKIKIYEYWRPRKVKLTKEFLQKHLKSGANTITLIVYNVRELKELNTSKKQLSFLARGHGSNLKKDLKIEKPKSYFSKSNLPIVKINTNNKFIPDEPKIEAHLCIINNKFGKNLLLDSGIVHNIKIERRGNTSQTFAKKSYSFNLYDEKKQKKTQPLVNLPASNRWVLYGPFADKTLIRNALTYSVYRQMGNYAPRTQFIDLVVNNNYRGIYVLTEKIQLSKSHLNVPPLVIDRNDSTKATGGYLLEIDRNEWKSIYPPKEDSSAKPTAFMVYSPKKKNISKALQNKIINQYNTFEKQLYENDNVYNYLDLNSFIDYLIITEFTKNIDGYCLSTFLYNKNINNKTPKFYIGPIWDYNFSLGLTNYHDGFNPEGYIYNSSEYIPFWWKTLLEDAEFKSALEERYFNLRKNVLSNQNINHQIDSLTGICKNSIELNFKKWPVLNSPDFWPNYYVGKDYNDEVNYLKSWIKKRLSFLDNDILAKTKKGISYYEIAIRNNPEWMKEIKRKAKERKISVEEMITIDAKHMAKKER